MKSLTTLVAGTFLSVGLLALPAPAAHAASPADPNSAVMSSSVRGARLAAPHALSGDALLALGATQSPAGPATAQAEDAALAAREAAAPSLQTFRGGGRYVYVSTGAAVVLVVLLILLL